ncbi:furin-like repeat-containing protein [bacterium]|nr:furin-like repeat-containing protein [bacterium]
MADEVNPNKHPSRRLRALKPSGYVPESYEEYYGAEEQAELFDIMQGVRAEDRFSGKYGILPYLGYYGSGDPDDPAYGVSSINKYDVKNPEDLSQSRLSSTWEDPDKLMRIPKSRMLGFYNPVSLPIEYSGQEDIQYLKGSEYPSPGASGISAFYPQADFLPLTPEEQSTRVYTRGSPFLSSQEVRTGKVDLGEGSPREALVGNRSFPGVTVHELMHRGFNTEAVKDFSKEFSIDDPEYVMANDFFINPRTEAMDSYFQHMLIDSRDIADSIYSEQKDPARIREPYRDILGNFQDQFLEWLTPEKQAQYGIDLPDSEKLKAMGYQDGGPVYLANGGTGTNIDNAAFTVPNVTTYLPNYAPSLQGYFDDIGGISKAAAHAMNTAIEEGLATLEEQDPSKWTQEQIDAFNTGIEDRIIAAAAADTNDVQLAAAAAAIEAGRLPTPLTENEKWEEWDDFLDNYERSDDLNADIQDAAEKAIEIFGYGTDAGKQAFLMAAAQAGLSTAQIADATGTTEASILANLPDISPVDYAKEAVTAVVEAIKKADGACIVGFDGNVTCDFSWGGQPPFGAGQQQSGVPVWKIPGTNTTVGIDTGYNILNAVLGAVSPAGAGMPWEDLPEIIYGAVIAEIKGTISDTAKEEIYNAVLSVTDDGGNIDLGVDFQKNCYNDDGSIESQVLQGQSCPPGTSETAPGGTQTTTTTCYVENATDGSTVPALENGTCPMGSSTTDPRTIETGETAESRCTTSGGTYENGVCNCGDDPTIELVDGQCMVKDGSSSRTPEEVCVTNRDGTPTGNTWVDGQCVGPAAGTETLSDQEKCEANGNTWTTLEDGTQTCVTGGGVVNDDDKEKACDIKGGNFYWNRSNQTCVDRCPGGGLYNAEKDLCETTPSGTTFNSDHTTCENITDYNQPALANGLFPTVTQNFTAAEFAAIGGVCPTHFGTAPKDDDDDDCQIVDGVQYVKNTEGVCVPPPDDGCQIVDGVQYVKNTEGVCVPPPDNGGCPPGQELFNDQCVDKCPDGQKRNTTTGICVKGGGGGLTCPTHAYDDDGVCVCTGGYAPTYSADGTLTACTLIDPGCPTNGELNEFGECVCKEGFTPGYTEGVLTSCTKTGGGGCPPGQELFNDQCVDKCAEGETRNTTTGICETGGGDECPANSTRNDAGGCDCNTGYSASTDSAGVMTCVLNFPAQDCSNPAWAATHVAECGSCEDKEYAEANPQICGIKEDDPYTRPYATFEGVDMVRPPWVTPPDVRIDRYPATEPSTYSTLPAPAGSYEYGISSLARRPQDIREAVSVIDPGYEQLRGGPPVFTMEEVSPEEEASRRAATDRYYGAMNRLSDYSTDFNVGADELSEALGVPRTNFNEAPADGGFNLHGGNFNYATPTYGTPPEGYPTSPDILAAADRPFSSPWLEEEEEEESMFAYGGEVAEEPQGLESLLQRRQSAVNTMLVKRGRGNGVQ